MNSVPKVLFDLDGTLIDLDSTGLFIRRRLMASPLRLAAALLLAPPLIALMLNRRTVSLGGSGFLWLATWGLSEPDLQRVARAQVQSLPLEEIRLDGAVRAIEANREEGSAVVIVTASAAVIAVPLCARLDPGARVLSSTLRPWLGGWVADRHLRGEAKVRALREDGMDDGVSAVYGDSTADLPMMRVGDRAYLVNVGGRKARRMTADLESHGVKVVRETWKRRSA